MNAARVAAFDEHVLDEHQNSEGEVGHREVIGGRRGRTVTGQVPGDDVEVLAQCLRGCPHRVVADVPRDGPSTRNGLVASPSARATPDMTGTAFTLISARGR